MTDEIRVDLTMKEIYKLLCPKCKEKMEAKVKEKMQDQVVKKMLEEGG